MVNNAINTGFSELLAQLGQSFKIDTHTRYNSGGLDGQQQGTAGITLEISNPALDDSGSLSKEILSKLSTVKVLADNVQFESQRKHAENMAKSLRDFIAEGAQVPESFAEWFDRQALKDTEKRPDHALNVEKNDLGIRIRIEVPKGQDATLIARKIEENKTSIIEALAKRTIKYWNADDKDTVEAQIKALDYVITSEKTDYDNSVVIEIRSKEQLEKIKGAQNKWNVTLSGDEPKTLRMTNPLSSLPDGDGKTPESPALLQKALARAILFDDKTPREYFPQIAGSKDMQIAVVKALVRLKNENPTLAEKVDKFLNDAMFKEHDRWHSRLEDEKGVPNIEKSAKSPNGVFEDGKIIIDLPLPPAKFDSIMANLEKDINAAIETGKNRSDPAAVTMPATAGNNETVTLPGAVTQVDAAVPVSDVPGVTNAAIAAAGATPLDTATLAAGTTKVDVGAIKQPPFNLSTTPPAVTEALAAAGANVSVAR